MVTRIRVAAEAMVTEASSTFTQTTANMARACCCCWSPVLMRDDAVVALKTNNPETREPNARLYLSEI